MRQPLSNAEMFDMLDQLLQKKMFKSDRDRAIYLSGYKLGIIAGFSGGMEKEEVVRHIKAILTFQEFYDPNKETWGNSSQGSDNKE